MVCIIEDNFQIQAPRGLFSEGLIIGGIFAFQNWRAYIRRGLFLEFYGMIRQELINGLLDKINLEKKFNFFPM